MSSDAFFFFANFGTFFPHTYPIPHPPPPPPPPTPGRRCKNRYVFGCFIFCKFWNIFPLHLSYAPPPSSRVGGGGGGGGGGIGDRYVFGWFFFANFGTFFLYNLNAAMTLAILLSLKTMVSLQNGVATHFQATPLI